MKRRKSKDEEEVREEGRGEDLLPGVPPRRVRGGQKSRPFIGLGRPMGGGLPRSPNCEIRPGVK